MTPERTSARPGNTTNRKSQISCSASQSSSSSSTSGARGRHSHRAFLEATMITCQSCGAQSNDGALICSACGKPLSQTATPSAAPPAAPTSPQPSRAISPDAEKAMRHAADQARGVVSNLGPEKTTSIAGGVLGLLGALLPFYVIPNVADVLGNGGGTSTSSSLVNQGSEGIIVMLLA